MLGDVGLMIPLTHYWSSGPVVRALLPDSQRQGFDSLLGLPTGYEPCV